MGGEDRSPGRRDSLSFADGQSERGADQEGSAQTRRGKSGASGTQEAEHSGTGEAHDSSARPHAESAQSARDLLRDGADSAQRPAAHAFQSRSQHVSRQVSLEQSALPERQVAHSVHDLAQLQKQLLLEHRDWYETVGKLRKQQQPLPQAAQDARVQSPEGARSPGTP